MVYVIAVLDVIICVALVALVMMQEGSSTGWELLAAAQIHSSVITKDAVWIRC